MAQKIKIKRSTNLSVPANGSLEHGELATSQVDVAGFTRTSLHIGNPDNNTSTVLISSAEQLTNLLSNTVGTNTSVKGLTTLNGVYGSAFFITNDVSDPTATSDAASGFVKGSLWFNKANQKLWSAESVNNGAAVWNLVSAPLTAPLTYKGVIDASVNPNYPAAVPGDLYVISVAGIIGGINGDTVEAADQILCITATAGGDKATAGNAFNIVQSNIAGAVTSSSLSSIDNNIAVFDGTTGKVIKDAGKAYNVASVASTLVDRDANKRIAANGIINDVNLITTAGAQTVTLTNASNRISSFQNTIAANASNIAILPDAATLPLGDVFSFYNGTAGLLEIKEVDGVVKNILLPEEAITLKLVKKTTARGVWKYSREEASFDVIDGGIF